MNYEKLMSHKPTVYGEMTNSQGQKIVFVEHPTRGDEYPVIAVCHELKQAGTTDFFELDDMTASHGEYEPWFNEEGELEIG
jgi:UDP:flavonoid glycosyltransferase YjiC (YdhE family)